jgi:hypothetical protein
VKHLSDLASVLVAQAPRQQASNVLSFLVNRARASGGALLTFRDQSLVLFCSTPDLQAASVVRAWGAWDTHRQRIESGETIQTPDQVLAPLKDDGALVGLLHLDAPQGFDSSLLSTFGLVLAKAVQSDLTADRSVAVAEIVDVPEQSKDRLAAVDAILEALPGGERRHGLRGNADFLAVEGAAAGARLALSRRERAETHHRHPVSLGHARHDRIEYRVHGLARARLAQVAGPRGRFDEISLGDGSHGFVISPSRERGSMIITSSREDNEEKVRECMRVSAFPKEAR